MKKQSRAADASGRPKFAAGGPVMPGSGAEVSGKTFTVKFALPGAQAKPRGRFSLKNHQTMKQFFQRE